MRWMAGTTRLWRSQLSGHLSTSSSTRAFTALPIIDIAALRDPSAVGFFYVTNHGVPPSIHEGVLRTARQWFQLPTSVKQQIAISPDKGYRGFQALGANVTRYQGGFQRDWHEAIDLYKEVGARERAALSPSPVHGLNQWPHQLPEFDALLRQFIDEMTQLGSTIMRGISMGLGLPANHAEQSYTHDSYWCVRVIHYPPLATAARAASGLDAQAAAAVKGAEVSREVQLSCGEHTDYGLLTLVNQESHVSALQVKNAHGQWITAHPIPGAFVCNIGDMLRVLTNGRYTPTAHRVINADPEQDRVSIPFFFEPNFDAEIAPIAQLLEPGEAPAHAPICYGHHLQRKVLSNFEL